MSKKENVMSENKVIVGVFPDRALAEQAVKDLQAAGFRDDQIGMIIRDERSDTEALPTDEQHTTTEKGAAGGMVAGGVVGGVLGTALAFLIPDGSAFLGKLLATTLGGAALGAATGGVIGLLVNNGVSEEDARYYEQEYQSGRTIVIVQADENPLDAFHILARNRAYNASSHSLEASPNNDPAATVELWLPDELATTEG
jgi:outer membrane lipoprotein SlyB